MIHSTKGREDIHIGVGSGGIGCVHTCVDESVVAMLEVGYVNAENLVDVV